MKQNPPLIAHVIYRLGVGGLENGLVNLINRIPPERYRHAIICLKDSTDFSRRIQREDVQIICLHRKDGQDFGMFAKLYALLRELRPDIVHTRNLAALECQVPAWLAGVRCRIHGEHGWDVSDPGGTNRKYQWLRRALRPWVRRWIPLSRHTEAYLLDKVGVPAAKIRRICNGVNTDVFFPPVDWKPGIAGCPFPDPRQLTLLGTVGRMHGVKDQMTLARAFIELLRIRPAARDTARLVLVGEGPLRGEAAAELRAAGLEDLAWLPGERGDVPAILRGLDIFVLPSIAEGISNAILEAMASGLPVVATDVGGNADLVVDGETGRLLEAGKPAAMAAVLAEYLDDPDKIRAHGAAGLRRVLERFSLDSMVGQYLAVYDEIRQ
ncbi:MAG: TIGR03088 family PEP-CTERM/XrtA system glycosyltransferase [Candidatus Methylumidiphilus sp.]